MATTSKRRTIAELPPEELGAMLDLVKSSDTVELKLTVPSEQHRSALRALKVDPIEAQIRQVAFWDTPDLKLNQAGLVARSRRVQGRAGDTVIKLRPVVPADLPEKLRRSPSLGVEVNAMPGGHVCSASMKGRVPNEEIAAAMGGKLALRRLFTKEQKAFYKVHAPDGIALDDLEMLGPIFVLKLAYMPQGGFNRRTVVEMWLYPDGSRILELSTKCQPNEMLQVGAEARVYLHGLGIDLSGEQQTKTKTALEFYSQGS